MKKINYKTILCIFSLVFIFASLFIFSVNKVDAEYAPSVINLNTTRTLKLAIPRLKGDDVKALQIFLNNASYNTGTPDGIFGPKTKSAVVAFQRAKGLITDGSVGPKTRNIINTLPASIASSISQTSQSSVAGCLQGYLFSITTGQPCSKSTTPVQTIILPRITGGGSSYHAVPLIQLTISDPTITTSKVYDASTTANISVGALSGVTGSDLVTVTALATYDNKNAGTGKTITVVYTLGGADAGKYIKPANYTISTGEITKAQLTMDNPPSLVTTKVYDKTNTVAVNSIGILSGVYPFEDVSVSITSATYNGINAQHGKPITVVYGMAGADIGNYIRPLNYTTSGTINPIQLTISDPTLTTSKAFDNTTSAAVTAGTLSGIISGDDVTVTALANYDTATAGTGKTITTVYTLGGAQAGNYIKPVDYVVVNMGVITTIQLTISAPTLTTSKTYDGNTTAVVTPGTLSGTLTGDTVTVSAVATYDTANVGTGKTITVVYTLGGADAGKYIKPVDYVINTGVINITLIVSDSSFIGNNYSVSVGYDVSSITVTFTAENSASTITVNGTAVVSGSTSDPITLNLGSNTIPVVVTTDGATQNYTITITRVDTSLSNLSIMGIPGSSPMFLGPAGFQSTIFEYTSTTGKGKVAVTPTTAGTGSTIQVNETTVASGSASPQITLTGKTTVQVTVTLNNITTTYKIVIN